MTYYLINIFLGMVNRKVLLNVMGVEYQGVNGLFSNVLSMLSLAELAKIVEIQTASLKKRVNEQGYELEITENAKVYLANEGYEPLYGARPLRRVIRNAVEIPLSMRILANEYRHGDIIVIDCVNDELVFNKKSTLE